MKQLILIVTSITLLGCQKNKESIINDFFDSLNRKDTNTVNHLLNDKLQAKVDDEIINKDDFVNYLIKGYSINKKYNILNIEDKDSILIVKIEIQSPLDTILKIKTLPINNFSLKIQNGKIINIESVKEKQSNKTHNDEYWKIYSAVLFYLDDNHFLDSVMTDTPNKREVINNIITNHAHKFFQENGEIQTKYLKTSSLRGVYKCNNCIYKIIEFKGTSTCLVLGFYATSYVVDENYIRIRTDKGDLLLKIIDENTLEGEGWAEGYYKKVK